MLVIFIIVVGLIILSSIGAGYSNTLGNTYDGSSHSSMNDNHDFSNQWGYMDADGDGINDFFE